MSGVELVNLVPVIPCQCLVLYGSEQNCIEIKNALDRCLHSIVSKPVQVLQLVHRGNVHGSWIHLSKYLTSHTCSETGPIHLVIIERFRVQNMVNHDLWPILPFLDLSPS